MSAATPTGAELRARREALGWSVDDARAASRAVIGSPARIEDIESTGDAPAVQSLGRDAYMTALDAEEARRAAEPLKVGDWVRVTGVGGAVYQIGEVADPFGDTLYYRERLGSASCSWAASSLERVPPPEPEVSAEPVPPKGVTVVDNGTNLVVRRSCKTTIAHVGRDGRVMILHDRCADPDALEYVAALSRYRAAQHAAGDRERKLAAVKAAEEAVIEAHEALADACRALDAARKEAGLT